MRRSDWKKVNTVAILRTSFFLPWLLVAAVAEEQPALEVAELRRREALEARREAELQSAELRAALQRRQEELTKLRGRYADLLLASREQQEELEYLELRAAGLLSDREDIASGRALAKAVAAVAKLRAGLREHNEALARFDMYLDSVLAVLQPSAAMRREIKERFADLEQTAALPLEPLSEVAGRGSGTLTRTSCRVLAVNDDLQLVVLDKGYRDGVRAGTSWRVVSGTDELAQLRIIDVRAARSGAMVIRGRFEAVGPGALVQPTDG